MCWCGPLGLGLCGNRLLFAPLGLLGLDLGLAYAMNRSLPSWVFYGWCEISAPWDCAVAGGPWADMVPMRNQVVMLVGPFGRVYLGLLSLCEIEC